MAAVGSRWHGIIAVGAWATNLGGPGVDKVEVPHDLGMEGL